jgi:hypothetical protein
MPVGHAAETSPERQNAAAPIVRTPAGMSTDVRLAQDSNAESPMAVSPSGRRISCSARQPEKASSGMASTD